jgi:hypothetical protein
MSGIIFHSEWGKAKSVFGGSGIVSIESSATGWLVAAPTERSVNMRDT